MRVSARQVAALIVLVVAVPLRPTLGGVAFADDLPTYRPPSRGAPSGRVGAGTRGVPAHAQQIVVFAPDHTGLTTREQPSLYWFLSKPVATRVEIAPNSGQAESRLIVLSIPAPTAAGVQKLDLALHGIRLQPAVQYHWQVSLELDPNQRSRIGMIERVAASPKLLERLQAPGSSPVLVYADEGIWYDAIASISDLIEQFPNDAKLRLQRASLLEQVGLKEAAASDLQR